MRSVGLAGSTHIGDTAFWRGRWARAGHLTVGDGAVNHGAKRRAQRCSRVRSIPAIRRGEREWLKMMAASESFAELQRRVQQLEAEVGGAREE